MANPDSLVDSTYFSPAERVVLAAVEAAAIGYLACGSQEEQVIEEEPDVRRSIVDHSYAGVVAFIGGGKPIYPSSEAV